MPTIEVLPSSSTTSGPNWTYSNLPPALAHRNTLPVATRVRATRNNNFENSAARQRQINTRILELENDNYRDVNIPIPVKGKGGRSSNRTKASSTQNIRRILASQKTFANHLADEEALHPSVTGSATATPSHPTSGLLDAQAQVLQDEEDAGQPLGYMAAASAPLQNPRGYSVRFVGIGGSTDAKGARQGIADWNVVLCIRIRGVISFMPSVKEFYCCVFGEGFKSVPLEFGSIFYGLAAG